jgi:hypothetical protein
MQISDEALDEFMVLYLRTMPFNAIPRVAGSAYAAPIIR